MEVLNIALSVINVALSATLLVIVVKHYDTK